IGTNIEAFAANGSVIATAVASDVAPPTLRAVAARQDLYLDPEGHKVSVLFSRPVALETNGIAREKFHPAIAFDRDGVAFTGPRPIFAAALQDSGDIANLSFDHVLTTNAAYTIAIDPLVDPVANSVVSFAPLTPKIDNERPAGIIYGRFLKGDNTPITNAEVRLFSGHHRGCLFGLFGDEPPLDCNPYREPPQYAATDGSGAYLFEYVPRDPIADFQLDGGYRLLGVNADGRFTIVDGTVRRPGVVHFVNLQLLGRGAAEGVVRYEDGARVAGAEVFVANTMFSTGRRTRTDASGSFRIDDLPVGPITFGASDARGNTAFAASEIATPGQVAGIDLTIVRQPFPGVGAIRGRVVRSDDGRPVGGARVGVSTQGFGLDETLTDAEGRYEFRRVPAGFVTVLAANWSIAGEAAHADFDLRADETVEVPPLILPIRTAEDPVTAVDGVVLREDPLHPGDPSFYQPVRGAVIAIGSREPIFSDTTGRFTLAAVPIRYGGIVEVRAYDPETRRNAALRLPTLSEGGPNNVAIFIPARAFGAGLIRVRLLSAYGAPVSGFRVIVPGLPPMRLEETGGGLYELRNVRIGAPVTIFAAGGPAAYGDQFAVGTAQVTYPGQTITLTLRLPGDGTVRVRLRSDIDLIGEVALSYPAWDEAEQSPAIKTRTVSTSVDGAASWATFADVPALGDYKIVSLHPVHGYATAAGRLMYDGDLADHVLRMSRLSTVRGTLYAIDGVTPIGGATVRLSDGRRDAGALLTASDGTFAFHDVPAGISFRVIAEATQSGIYRTGIAYGTTPDGGGPVEGVSVVLRTRGVVEGRVVYRDYKVFDPRNAANNVADDTPGVLSDNAPVATAKFWLRELSFPDRAFGNDASPLVTDLAGNFVVPNVFTGPLRARAWDASNPDVQGSWSGELSAEGGTLSGERAIIAIGDGGVATINVTVVDPNQALLPVANAEVSLHAGRLFDFATTDGTGVARFHGVPVGTYSVSAFSKSLGRSGGSASFAIGRDDVRHVRVLLEFSGRVTGTLTDPESAPAGAPVRGAAVTLTGNNYQTRASTTVDGAFEFGGVREGMFALDAKDTRTNRRARATRNLSAADPQPHVNLFLEATESLHVAVYLPNDTGGNSGVLAPPVEVTATQRNSDYVRTLTGNPVVLPSLFRDQPYEVAVREIGGQRRQFKASHSFPNGSAATPLTFVYPATGTVEVLVRRSGAPASSARVRIRSGAAAMDFFTGADGLATATSMPLGIIGVQATTIDGTFSASASGSLTRSSAPLRLVLDLGAFAGISGVVEAEAGGPSQGTRVIATFASRTLETLTDADGRYGFTGIPSLPVATTTVDMVYLGPDGVTIGARQTATITSAHASQTVSLPPVRLDATPPQLVAVSPVDGSVEVPPDTFIRFAFSEPIAPALISNAHFTLIAADGSGALISAFDPPFVDREGRTVITMRPPPAVPFPLRSNTLYRVFVSGEVTDRSGHRLGAPRSIAFTTSDYTEPRLISRIPAAGIPASRAQSFEFRFSEAIESGAIVRLFKIDVPGGSAIVELAGDSFIDPSNAARLMFAARDPLQPESYYRILLSGVRDLQGNAVAPQSFEYASFDERRPFVNFLSPVAGGTPLVSGVEYTLGVDVRNVTPDGTAATDLASVEWFQAGTSSDMFLRRETAPPFSYRFVAPEAPSGGLSYSLRALATDLSGNVSEPATITFTVQPNVAPANVSVTVAPQSAYPGSVVTARVTFDDEGIVATVATKLRAT
ncbi:MAG TPA: carboxypeptidase regulatory-like domain-containing protein, partial [Thermoanaerobaculia bacterium]